jgi:hypothetical protein
VINLGWLLEHGEKIGLITTLFTLLFCWIKGWIVAGWTYKQAIKDCDYWKDTSQRLIGNMERTLNVTESLGTRK